MVILEKPSVYFSRSLAIEATPADLLPGWHTPKFYPIAAWTGRTKTPSLGFALRCNLFNPSLRLKFPILAVTCHFGTQQPFSGESVL